MKDEIVIYQPNETFQLEVHVQDDPVWLNRQQMALLFDRDVKTIGKHIKNALQEELKPVVANFATTQNIKRNPVVSIFATTAADGKTYQVEYYNLDMILSVGYRVKSNRGIEFRRWANQVLKEYLLKGYVFNQRFQTIENKLEEHALTLAEHNEKLDFFIRTSLPPKEDQQYPNIDVHEFGLSHDRFLIIDNTVYHIGASLKDLGKRWFAFSKMDDITAELLINRLTNQ